MEPNRAVCGRVDLGSPSIDSDGMCPSASRPSSQFPEAMPGGFHCHLSRGLISLRGDSLQALIRMPVGWRKRRAECQG